MTNATDALLPCPFCGGKACWEAGSDNQHWAGATCKACGVTLDDQDSGCMERVAAAWNTRATPAGSASGEATDDDARVRWDYGPYSHVECTTPEQSP